MLVVCVAFRVAHRVVLQFLACFAQSWSCSFLVDDSLLKVSHPFLKWRLSHLVEIVDTHKIICREKLGRIFLLDNALLLCAYNKMVFGMNAHEIVLSDIQIVGSSSEVEIENADGVNFLHLLICVSEFYMLGYGFSHTI